MKKTVWMVILMVLILCAYPKHVKAATLLGDYLKDKGIEAEVTASVDFYDKYVWRGFLLDNDSVLQPAVTISVAGFEGGFWGSWDLESHDGLASDEVDGWIGYSFDLGFIDEQLAMVGVSIGNTWYDFPEASTYTKELYLGISLDTFLSPSVTWYHDYGDEAHGGADGNYIMLAAGHSFTLNEEYGITLDVGEEVNFNDEAFIMGDGGYWLTTVGFTIPLSENVTISPSMGYSVPFGDLEDAADGAQDEEFYGGASLAFSF